MEKNFEVKSVQRVYPVEFISQIETLCGRLKQIQNPIFVIDKKVRDLYREKLMSLFLSSPVLEIEATEDNKSLAGVEVVVDWFIQNKVTKSNHILVIGGGIIQDLAAFTAGIYFRGIPWSFVPTTLLSMSDSCIGAKTGINWKAAKNQLGSFNSPFGVYICTEFIGTLSENDIKSGYGEILKLHLTVSYDKFMDLAQSVGSAGTLFGPHTETHLYDSLQVKKAIIEKDEYENDLRRILNYGHTFGHALESVTNHEIPHGLAVAWGIDFVNYLAVQNGTLDQRKYLAIKAFIKNNLGFTGSCQLSSEKLMSVSRRDKKAAAAGEVNMIFFTNGDRLSISKMELNQAFKDNLENYIQTESVFRFN